MAHILINQNLRRHHSCHFDYIKAFWHFSSSEYMTTVAHVECIINKLYVINNKVDSKIS